MPTNVNELIAYIQQYIYANGHGAITGTVLATVLITIVGLFNTYQPSLATLPVCASQTVAPVPTGQPYQCQGIILIAQ